MMSLQAWLGRGGCRLAAMAFVVGGVAIFQGCQASQNPRVVDESERITTAGLDIQDIERFARELTEEMIAAGVLGEDDGPSDVLLREYLNDTRESGITRQRVVFPIMTTLLRSAVARPFDANDPDVLEKVDEAMFAGRELGDLYDFTLKVRLYEDTARLNNTRQVSYIIQLELIDITTPDGIPRSAWLDQRTITKQETRASLGF
ncbi:MAG: hypothetical protein AAF823_00475 [Planctomycetota bacterium]